MTELIFNVVDYCHWQTKENNKGKIERFCAYCSTDVFFEDTLVHFSYRNVDQKTFSAFCEYEGINLTTTAYRKHKFTWSEEVLRKTRGPITIENFKQDNYTLNFENEKNYIINEFLYRLLCDKFSDEFLSEYGIFPEEDYKNQELIYKR